jgi:peptidoglycan/xylan/chitin deacetylase (PgdA/CDA1 family)
MLNEKQIPATFFSTVVFASHEPDLIARIANEGHELASHGYFHSTFKNEDLLASRIELERLSNKNVKGFRMPRMMPVDDRELEKAGYRYNSSLNPIFLPGRYNNFLKPRTIFHSPDGTVQVPASATPFIRFPLFWLSFHNLPIWLYQAACRWTMKSDGYVNIYFHPWEFMDLENPKFGLPKFVSRNSGDKMIDRFFRLINWMREQDFTFTTMTEFCSLRAVKQL